MRGRELKAERVKRGLKQFELSLLLGFGYTLPLIKIENTNDPVPDNVLAEALEIFAAYDAQRKEPCK